MTCIVWLFCHNSWCSSSLLSEYCFNVQMIKVNLENLCNFLKTKRSKWRFFLFFCRACERWGFIISPYITSVPRLVHTHTHTNTLRFIFWLDLCHWECVLWLTSYPSVLMHLLTMLSKDVHSFRVNFNPFYYHL